ncbi:MAG: AAA family ATPase [Deltaproteobacteria bacterium]|nr:AAA family ATPase [Deltaproteobacteria bacterium]
MQLKRVDIQNFRSIESANVDFQPRCRILVGINEAGKTNILQALYLLNPQSKILPTDIREYRHDEDLNQDAYVRFVFIISDEERSQAMTSLGQKILSTRSDSPTFAFNGQEVSIDGFCRRRNEVLYIIDLKTNQRSMAVQKLGEDARLLENLRKVAPSCPKDFALTLPEGGTVLLANYSYVNTDGLPDVPKEYLVNANIADVSELFDNAVKAITSDKLPQCMYWSYKEENLLPGRINMETFSSNPDSCLPLKCMFKLAGVDSIPAEIAAAKVRQNGIRNLFNRVSDQSTQHMHNVWPEYKELIISLSQNGDNIEAVIQDKHNVYDMARRSDGFKRFVTFLLLISAPVECGDLENVLYLHDEPDTSLHPSGARHLRDELIRISKKNYVVYATHSIFMIDTKNIDRHLIVKKINEMTEIRHAEHSEIMDEEVLYNALGYSIFENLQPFNLIFEGWRDRRLFEVSLTRVPAEYKKVKGVLSRVGFCYAKGVKDISKVTAILELGKRKYIVISDGDQIAKEHQRAFRGEGPWMRYDEISQGKPIVTLEDYIDAEAFKDSLAKVREENPTLAEFDLNSLNDSRGRIASIQAWMSVGKIDQGNIKRAIEGIKESVIENLKPSQILETYYQSLQFLSDLVEGILKPPKKSRKLTP